MAEKENIDPCLTQAVAERAASAAAIATGAPVSRRSSTKRNRVALGELRSLANADSQISTSDHSVSPSHHPIPKTRRKKAKRRRVASTDEGSKRDDPQMCTRYVSDIYQYLRSMEAEATKRPLPNYMESVQRDITADMRGVLVDWLVEVAVEYKLVSDTLYHTVSYIDRFLSLNAITRQRLQLLGVSSMLIASKYEEVAAPTVDDFCYISDNTYTIKEVVKMESDILKSLRFELGNPTAITFLREFMQTSQQDGEAQHSNHQIQFIASYLAELSLLDYDCVQFLPSTVAASAIFLARFTLDPNSHPWSEKLKRTTCYSAADLTDCIHAIHDLQLKRKAVSLKFIHEKYKQHEFKCVSTLVTPLKIPTKYLSDDIKELI